MKRYVKSGLLRDIREVTYILILCAGISAYLYGMGVVLYWAYVYMTH